MSGPFRSFTRLLVQLANDCFEYDLRSCKFKHMEPAPLSLFPRNDTIYLQNLQVLSYFSYFFCGTKLQFNSYDLNEWNESLSSGESDLDLSI